MYKLKNAKRSRKVKREKYPSKKRTRRTRAQRIARKKADLERQNQKSNNEVAAIYAEKILLALLSDFFQTLPLYGLADYRHDVHTISTRIKAEGLSFVTKTITVLSSGMFDHLEGRQASYPTFKLWDRTYPVFLKGLFKHALGLSRESQNDHEFRVPYIRAIYQISVVFKKLKGPYKKSKLAEQYADFVAVDGALGKLDLTSECLQPILRRARFLCSKFLEGLDPRSGMPRPGPGATNTPTKKYERYEPHVLYRQVHDVLDYRDWFYISPFDVCYEAPSFLRLLKEAVDAPVSRFKFVPKTWDKARGICIEEFEVQWMQQGVRRALTKHIEQNQFYSSRIKFEDQSLNADLATTSSYWRDKATIDMSSASDRVARKLVEYLFQDHEDLCEILMALSTRFIKPPKEVKGQSLLETNMFAPMGSALCFPIMSLVHMFLIRAIIQLSAADHPHLLSTQVFVYGDDIVLPSSAVRAVYDWLPMFGMKLNETKSFYRSHFRESCGTHAYYGHIVTPIFIREVPKATSGRSLNSSVETEMQFHDAGYFSTSRSVREVLISFSKSINRYVPLTSTVVGFKRKYDDPYVPTGMRYAAFSNKVRVNDDHQTRLRKEWVFKPLTTQVGLCSDYHRYLRWWSERPSSNGDAYGHRMVCDTVAAVSLQSRWTPESECQLGAR